MNCCITYIFFNFGNVWTRNCVWLSWNSILLNVDKIEWIIYYLSENNFSAAKKQREHIKSVKTNVTLKPNFCSSLIKKADINWKQTNK